jgi:hypothetical protein
MSGGWTADGAGARRWEDAMVVLQHVVAPEGVAAGRGYSQVVEMPEIGPQLACLGRLVQARWVAQAIYFAARIERGIDRGPGGPAANHEGLAAAYQGMTAGSDAA